MKLNKIAVFFTFSLFAVSGVLGSEALDVMKQMDDAEVKPEVGHPFYTDDCG